MKSFVSVLFSRPNTILEDYSNLLDIIDFEKFIDKKNETLLKVNISWDKYYPGCSTAPWQLEGVIKKLQDSGFSEIISAHNGTVVFDPEEGRKHNKHDLVEDKYKIPYVVLDSGATKWIKFTPKSKLLVLDKIFPDGIYIPEIFIGKNIIHLPTVKTHVFTGMTGAMKNAFGGLLNRNRHWTHSSIHETLVDLLIIQKEIHTGILAVMDGTFAGEGPGPRATRIHSKNIILASSDQVAIDSVSAKLMGFDPLKIPKIRLAHELGLGIGDPRQIEFKGENVSKINWNFSRKENTFASWGQKLIYWGPLKPFEKLLLRSKISPWAFWASNIYHNFYWFKFIGAKRIKKAMKTGWGQLFKEYK